MLLLLSRRTPLPPNRERSLAVLSQDLEGKPAPKHAAGSCAGRPAPKTPLPLCTSPPTPGQTLRSRVPGSPHGGPHLLATQQPQTQGAARRLQHPKRTVGRDTHPDTGPGWLKLLFPCPPLNHEQEQRQGEPTAAAPPLTCASGESLGAAQPLKQAPLRSQASVGGCSARLWDFLPPPSSSLSFFFFFGAF